MLLSPSVFIDEYGIWEGKLIATCQVKQYKMSKKSSTVDPPTKKISLASLSGSDTPPRKKSSLKENFQNLMRAPNFLIKREAAKKRWNQVCENLHLGRIKIAVTESKLFSPGTAILRCYLGQE
ncbi:hypothetical protein Y032_0125g1289 [Ancylostoma ceylanicum]|uniref:Uncharacterized protein n=1 Tax=Ancylostoma ceylanicum TaxID=53326 RepID=A0A016T8V6_9BILA|nr:hypothetical protein Y032_0125g1289 [Ancylostoma ceylanicum]